MTTILGREASSGGAIVCRDDRNEQGQDFERGQDGIVAALLGTFIDEPRTDGRAENVA
jgi:hypothetical protein